MSDKEKEIQLKEEELEKVSGGLPERCGAAPKLSAQLVIGDDEESDQQNIVGEYRR